VSKPKQKRLRSEFEPCSHQADSK